MIVQKILATCPHDDCCIEHLVRVDYHCTTCRRDFCGDEIDPTNPTPTQMEVVLAAFGWSPEYAPSS